MENCDTTTLPLEVFTWRNFVANIIRLKVNFIFFKQKRATLWGLRGNVRSPSISLWKASGPLPIRHNWTVSLLITLETLYAEICPSRRFSKGVGHFERKFQTEGGVAHQPLLVSKTRVIAVSCGINISAVYCLVLSQSTRVTDRRTDRITSPKTALDSCVAGKNERKCVLSRYCKYIEFIQF